MESAVEVQYGIVFGKLLKIFAQFFRFDRFEGLEEIGDGQFFAFLPAVETAVGRVGKSNRAVGLKTADQIGLVGDDGAEAFFFLRDLGERFCGAFRAAGGEQQIGSRHDADIAPDQPPARGFIGGHERPAFLQQGINGEARDEQRACCRTTGAEPQCAPHQKRIRQIHQRIFSLLHAMDEPRVEGNQGSRHQSGQAKNRLHDAKKAPAEGRGRAPNDDGRRPRPARRARSAACSMVCWKNYPRRSAGGRSSRRRRRPR